MLSFLSPFGKKRIASQSPASAKAVRSVRRKGSRPGMTAHALFDAVGRFESRD